MIGTKEAMPALPPGPDQRRGLGAGTLGGWALNSLAGTAEGLKRSMLWSHIPNMAIEPATSKIPHHGHSRILD